VVEQENGLKTQPQNSGMQVVEANDSSAIEVVLWVIPEIERRPRERQLVDIHAPLRAGRLLLRDRGGRCDRHGLRLGPGQVRALTLRLEPLHLRMI
jgi:hypothetical protein